MDLAEAIEGAMRNGGGIATLIVPHDSQIAEAAWQYSGSPRGSEEDLFVTGR